MNPDRLRLEPHIFLAETSAPSAPSAATDEVATEWADTVPADFTLLIDHGATASMPLDGLEIRELDDSGLFRHFFPS
ncbi:hypothetical protein [Caldimonas sp. KR1-144]|uniref:hypothetical protein n=1 Tax=Caldimonas sp. KR1-144 TaxID=3400911 RepID=UPI003C08A7C8